MEALQGATALSPGRPPLPAEQKRTIRKGVSFSRAEYDRLCLTAMKLRMDVNSFIRLMVVPDRVKSRHGQASALPSVQ